MQSPTEFVALFERLRLARGLSAADVARHLGVRDSVVSRWRNGSVSPNWENCQRLGQLLGVDPLELWALVTRPTNNLTDKQASGLAALDQDRAKYREQYDYLLEHKVPRGAWDAYLAACRAMAETFSDAVADARRSLLSAPETPSLSDQSRISDQGTDETPGKGLAAFSRQLARA